MISGARGEAEDDGTGDVEATIARQLCAEAQVPVLAVGDEVLVEEPDRESVASLDAETIFRRIGFLYDSFTVRTVQEEWERGNGVRGKRGQGPKFVFDAAPSCRIFTSCRAKFESNTREPSTT